MNNKRRKIILLVSVLLSALVIFSSLMGIFSPGFYSGESENWRVQSIGQDYVNLYVCIVLPISAISVFGKNRHALLVWSGVILYLFYTYTIYCFDVHFNVLFVLYCAILGLCFYSMIGVFYHRVIEVRPEIISNSIFRITAYYFLTLAGLFYFLWLKKITPAQIKGVPPEELNETGLFTNPVHVLDLAIFLPGIIITGLLILKGKRLGYLLAPVLLTFIILMDLTIGLLTIIMEKKGVLTDLSLVSIIGLLLMLSIGMLVMNMKNLRFV